MNNTQTFNNKQMIMEKLLYPNHAVRFIIVGTSNVGKPYFPMILILNYITEFDKEYVFSPSLHQD